MPPLQDLLFYFYASLLVAGATAVVVSKNQVHSALFLVFSFFTASLLWLLLEVEFLAIALIVVYVGAVMVLFLFVIMMLDMSGYRLQRKIGPYIPVALALMLVMLTEALALVGARRFSPSEFPRPEARDLDYSNIQELGLSLYTDYLFPFEVAGVILLVSLVAALVLTFRPRRDTRRPNPERQLQARKEDRLRIVDIKSAGGDKS